MLLASLAFVPAGLVAQDNGGSERKTEKTPAMSQKVYDALTKAQELIEEKKYNEGLAALRELERQEGLEPYEKAQMYNYFAYTYFTMERYKDAIDAYRKVLAQPELPTGLVRNSLYTVAQLYFITEEYRNAVDTINKWFEVAEKPTENAYMLLGQGYYQLEEYKKALDPLKKAYRMVREKGEKPKENLLLLLRVIYFNLEDYQNMIAILKELVDMYPKNEYWLTLAGVYSELKQYEKQMSILEILYERGALERGAQQLNLANLFLLNDVPYKAAQVLEKGINEGKIEEDVRNLRLLSQAWSQAQYPEESIPPLKKAAQKSDDGDLHMRLAQSYINLDRYEEAVSELRTAFDKGNLKRPDQARVMLGMALFELERFDASKEAFRLASRDDRSRKAAEQWLSYVSNEQTRKDQLRKSLEQRRQ
ncbi:MAG: CDC27 family protein [Gammaproteobacteria bacterium]